MGRRTWHHPAPARHRRRFTDDDIRLELDAFCLSRLGSEREDETTPGRAEFAAGGLLGLYQSAKPSPEAQDRRSRSTGLDGGS